MTVSPVGRYGFRWVRLGPVAYRVDEFAGGVQGARQRRDRVGRGAGHRGSSGNRANGDQTAAHPSGTADIAEAGPGRTRLTPTAAPPTAADQRAGRGLYPHIRKR